MRFILVVIFGWSPWLLAFGDSFNGEVCRTQIDIATAKPIVWLTDSPEGDLPVKYPIARTEIFSPGDLALALKSFGEAWASYLVGLVGEQSEIRLGFAAPTAREIEVHLVSPLSRAAQQTLQRDGASGACGQCLNERLQTVFAYSAIKEGRWVRMAEVTLSVQPTGEITVVPIQELYGRPPNLSPGVDRRTYVGPVAAFHRGGGGGCPGGVCGVRRR